MIKKTAGFLSASMLAMLFAAPASYADVPDTDPHTFGLASSWPPGGLDVQHPPFVYDFFPNDNASKATFNTTTCVGNVCAPGSAFFIETDREDEKTCVITAGHVADNLTLKLPESSETEGSDSSLRNGRRISGKTSIALNYHRLDPSTQNVSFFGNVMPEGSMHVVRNIQDQPIYSSEEEEGYFRDIALLLIDTSRLKGRAMTSTLPYSYVPAGSLPAGSPVVKGHPHGWPLHRNEFFSMTAYPGQFALSAELDGMLAEGSSGGPWVHQGEQGPAFAVSTCAADCENFLGDDQQHVFASYLTILKDDIEATCKQSERPKYVYKTSTRVPTMAFAAGFVPPGRNRDVVAHVSGASCQDGKADTAFVSTTKNQAVAYERALAVASAYPGQAVYIYRIRADEKFYNAKKSLQDSLKHFEKTSVSLLTVSQANLEQEFLFVDDVTFGGLPAENIAGAMMFKKEKDGAIRHQHFSNASFKPLQTKASSFSYVGPDSSGGKMNVTWVSKIGASALNGSCLMPGSVPEDVKRFPAELLHLHVPVEL